MPPRTIACTFRRNSRQKFPGFKVSNRFGDPQAKDARGIWAARGLFINRYGTKDLRLSIGYIRESLEDDPLVIVARVEMLPKELEAHTYGEKRAG